MKKYALIFAFVLLLPAFSQAADTDSFGETISIHWKLISNFTETPDVCRTSFTLTNNGEKTLAGNNWSIYYNQDTYESAPMPPERTEWGNVEHINGYLYRINPSEKFELKPGEPKTIERDFIGAITRWHDLPKGYYFVFNEGTPEQSIVKIKHYDAEPLTRPEQVNRGPKDVMPLATPAWRFQENRTWSPLPQRDLYPVVPRPVSIAPARGRSAINEKTVLVYEPAFKNEADYLNARLKERFGFSLESKELAAANANDANRIVLKQAEGKIADHDAEAYRLEVANRVGIAISGTDAAGVFYGIQTLLALLPAQSDAGELSVTAQTITDAPRFKHRSLLLDVSRHFHSKETVFKVIDLLANYKMNAINLRITEDEGWRIEIDGLPELTQVGGRRGHTLTGHDFLQPAFGTGPDPDDKTVYGHGYYTRADYIDIVRYAKARHVKVVPEMSFPTHTRGAVIAMEARYDRLMKEGKPEEAAEYRLRDPDDQSKYYSAQMFRDNIVCIGYDSTLRFYEKVVQEMKKMHEEAGAPLTFFNTGGDEIPEGAWMESPACKAMLDALPGPKTTRALSSVFAGKMIDMLHRNGITQIGGWEEIALMPDADGKLVPNPELLGKGVIPYAWHSIADEMDLGYRLANVGYSIVLCNVNNLYFDFCVYKHPEEPGLNWGGYVSAKNAFEFEPFNVLHSNRYFDPSGIPFNAKDHPEMQRLKPEARGNILGMQCQLWGETLSEKTMIESYLLPRLIIFSDNAWRERSWETIQNEARFKAAFDRDWNAMVNTIGQREFKRLDSLFGGYQYRIDPPGAVLRGGVLSANNEYPGFTIRYTTDGSEPTADSPVLARPTRVQGETIKLKSFNELGRSSRTATLEK